jgi:hypothetical protein
VIELDPALGTPLVHRALTDPHPHIRRAAQRSLERYEASDPRTSPTRGKAMALTLDVGTQDAITLDELPRLPVA